MTELYALLANLREIAKAVERPIARGLRVEPGLVREEVRAHREVERDLVIHIAIRARAPEAPRT